jgi:hypothetical protein
MGRFLRSFLLLGVAALALLAVEGEATAQRGYYGPGYGPRPSTYAPYYGGHAHDGFYMRVHLGMGYLGASESYGGGTDHYSGGGLSYGAAFGGSIAPNLILFGELFGTTVFDATYTYQGYSEPSGMDLTMYGIGPGVAYYIMPLNLYLSGSLAFSKISFSDTQSGVSLDDTRWGLGFNFMVGKEWWVARNWGLGVAGQLHVARMGDYVYDDATRYSYDTNITAATFSVLFSATYN